MNKDCQDFIDTIKASDIAILFDSFQETTYGLMYDFDGFMTCHLVLRGKQVYDVQDREIIPSDLSEWNCYATGREMAEAMIKTLGEPQ